MKKRVSVLVALLALTIFTIGCSGGGDGATGATGPAGTVDPAAVTDAADSAVALASINAESCAVCHSGYGVSKHQAVYDAYADTSAFTVTINSVVSVPNATDPAKFDSTMTFTILKDGVAYIDVDGLPSLDQKRFYAVKYNSATRQFTDAITYATAATGAVATPNDYIKSLGGGQYSTTKTAVAYAPEASNAAAYVYIADDKLTTEGMQLYDNVYNAGKAYGDVGAYASAANVAGCEKCHGTPYMKHGYRAAAVTGLSDFAACKTCHYDTRTGGHQSWQLLVDDPEQYATLYELAKAAATAGDTAHDSVEENMTATEKTTYAYTANVMNDTHMSHAMEFAYPQSMANCVVCHEGKLDTLTLTDANFTSATCKSCHPVTGPAEGTDAKRAPALATIMPSWHVISTTCNECHKAGNTVGAPLFSAIHSGYDKKIYAKDQKYSGIFKVTIDSASISGTDLTIKFSATKTDPTSATTLAVTGITPKVIVGLHGWDTKDYIVDAHGSDFDDNGDGKIATRNCGNACDYRNLEYDWGTANPRFTAVSAANGQWEVTAHLAAWSGLITDKTVKRIEIGVLPALKNADGDNVPVTSTPRTFDIATNALVGYFSGIVKADKCNNCHGALGITFHSAQYGNAGVVGCRFCHTTRPGGSHLEMQSRSIDSYVHAIHSFAPFDIGDIDFTDPVETLYYEHHIESTYPNFTITNCESCHEAGTYEVPDQAKSLGGTLSASDTVAGRSLTVPSYITGPGSRACGSCHRQMMINEGEFGELSSFNNHAKAGGYLTEATSSTMFDTVINKIMEMFK